MAVPGVRGSSDLPTALASGRGLRSQREERLLTSPLLKGRPSLLLRYHRVRSSHSHRVMASNARSRRREASSVSRPSQGEQFGTCNWDRAHVPPEVIRPRIGRHEDCRERQPCQCRHGYGPYANAHRVCHGSREAASARPAPLASVLLFLDTGCQGGLKIISRERVRPLRGRSAHVALAVSEGQTTLRGCGGRGAAWALTASEGQGLDPLETG